MTQTRPPPSSAAQTRCRFLRTPLLAVSFLAALLCLTAPVGAQTFAPPTSGGNADIGLPDGNTTTVQNIAAQIRKARGMSDAEPKLQFIFDAVPTADSGSRAPASQQKAKQKTKSMKKTENPHSPPWRVRLRLVEHRERALR